MIQASQPLKGGLLRAQYGKGTYIYAGYAFFRQLPAGVPGAIRLYVNSAERGTLRKPSLVAGLGRWPARLVAPASCRLS